MPLAALFPGQGSQKVQMLDELALENPIVQETFAEASAVLGYDAWQLVQEGPLEQLNETRYTQPVMLTANIACWRVWQQHGGPQPLALAGHSLGEYAALVAGGAIVFTDAVALVANRGRHMQEAVPLGEGAMAAVLGLDDDAVAQLCADQAQGQVLAPANFNTPGQVVIAGHSEAINRAVENAQGAGARLCKPIPVSVPVHCELMRPAGDKLAPELDELAIQMPVIPVVHNLDGQVCDSVDAIRSALKAHLYKPVQWVKCVQTLLAMGADSAIECGPNNVLTGLSKRIDRSFVTTGIGRPEPLAAALAAAQ